MNIKYLALLLTIAVSLVIIFPSQDLIAQGLRIEDKIGGSGSSGSSSSSSSDNSTIYIVGGVIIAGIVAYALLRDKGGNESDSSEVSLNENLKLKDNSEVQLSKIKDKIPVDFYFGMTNETAYLSGKKYLFGVSYRF